MENFENWNKNVKKRDLNSNENANLNDFNQRDYDKEPIVIKNPYEFFLANLFFFSHTGTFFILGTYAGYAGYVQFSEIKNVNIGFFGFLGVFWFFWLCILLLHFIITLSKTNAKPNLQIKR